MRNLISMVPFKYRMICLTAIQCIGPGFDISRLTTLTANARSNLVTTIALQASPPLIHGNNAGSPIPFEMNSKKEMQLAEVTHLELALEARLRLVDHVHIPRQNDEVLYICNYNHNIVASL